MNTAPHNHDARFLKLLADHRPKLLKICRVYAWNPADQEDLYQEILFQLWRALPNLREAHHAGTWLYRVALNTAISFVRKDQSRRGRLVTGLNPSHHDIPDNRARPNPATEEKLDLLTRGIARLNAAEKAVITLFLEDLTYEQMAEVLGVTENNIGVMLHRAKKKLSTLMQEDPCTTTP